MVDARVAAAVAAAAAAVGFSIGTWFGRQWHAPSPPPPPSTRAAAATKAKTKAKPAQDQETASFASWQTALVGPIDCRVVLSPSVTLALRRHGAPPSTATVRILALHGWLDNALSFDSLASCLPASWCIVAVDFAGHGLSSHRPEGTFYHTMDHVADVAALVHKHLKWDKFTLMGHSLGGGVATALAAACPDSIERAIIIESLGAWPTPAAKQPQQLARSIASSLKQHRPPRVFASLEAAAVRQSQGITKTPLDACRILVKRGCKRSADGSGFVWASDPRLREPSRMSFTDELCQAYIAAIRCPTLLVTAADGIYAHRDADTVQRRFTWFSGAKHVQLPDGGHHPHMTRAPLVAKAITSFVTASSVA